MSVVTYKNVSPEAIRTGDRVQDDTGRDFIAASDAEYNEKSFTYDVLTSDRRWISYDFMDGVTLTYTETEEYATY